MGNNEAWASALAEVESEGRDAGLWARCFAESNGDESKSKAIYVKARVQGESPQAESVAELGFCPNCVFQCSFDARACPNCKADFVGGGWKPVNVRPTRLPFGAKASDAPQIVKAAKSRGVYIILGLFFGLLGIHNFYAGRLGAGVAQLLVTVISGWFVVGLLITGIWVLIELFTVKVDGAGDAFA